MASFLQPIHFATDLLSRERIEKDCTGTQHYGKAVCGATRDSSSKSVLVPIAQPPLAHRGFIEYPTQQMTGESSDELSLLVSYFVLIIG